MGGGQWGCTGRLGWAAVPSITLKPTGGGCDLGSPHQHMGRGRSKLGAPSFLLGIVGHPLPMCRHRKCIHPIHPPSKAVTVEVRYMCVGTHSEQHQNEMHQQSCSVTSCVPAGAMHGAAAGHWQ
jgi:hypothetical protein